MHKHKGNFMFFYKVDRGPDGCYVVHPRREDHRFTLAGDMFQQRKIIAFSGSYLKSGDTRFIQAVRSFPGERGGKV